MNNIYYLNQEILKLETLRVNLQKSVLDVNERAIADADIDERKELYQSHDAIIDFINAQTTVINICVNQIQSMHTNAYVNDLKDLIKKQKYYIQLLGGNPSNLNYILNSDIC
jgi:hypothetical protein